MRRKQIAPSLPQAALIALEVPSGNILAMVGGRDFRTSPFNRATDAKRQPGSAFKPFVFGCAIENGFAQDMLVLDAPVAYRGVDGAGQWQPRNFSPGFHGEMTIRRALALSQNIPAVRLIEKLGPQAVIAFARRLGVEAALVPDLTLALGTSEMTLVELVKAYAVFPNRGELVSGSAVGEVVDRHGRVIWQTQRRRRVAMSRSGAAIVTDMLSAVIREGTGSAALSIRRPIAGKTGTSADSRDALFVGFSPSIAAGVWVGQDAGDTLGSGETGARAALPIWIDFMTAALHGMPPDYFDIPDGVVARPIDPIRGEPLGAGHPGAVQALFRKEARP